MSLTETLCKNAKPKHKTYKLFDSDGLYLEVTPKGQRYWRLKYVYCEKENRISLGVYPRTTLETARQRKEKAKTDLANGLDPALLKKEERQLAKYKAAQTFEQVTREWIERNGDTWTPTYKRKILAYLEMHLFPPIGHCPIHTLKPSQLLEALQRTEMTAPTTARTLLSLCSRVFHYAGATGRLDRDLTFGLKGALKKYKRGHCASIEIEELPAFLKAIHDHEKHLSALTRLALRLMLLTFVRTNELLKAKWEEFNFDKALWIIPAERMKMRKPLIVPLCRQALALFLELKELNGNREHVFASAANPRKPVSGTTILLALARIGYGKKMTGHGFRALAMGVIKQKLKYRHEVVDRQLAHEPKGNVNRAYDRATFLDDRIVMMQDYADYLDRVLHTQQTERPVNDRLTNTAPSTSTNTFAISYNGVSHYQRSIAFSTSQPLYLPEWNKSGALSPAC